MPDVKKVLTPDARTGWETTGKGIFFVVFIQEMGELFGCFDVKLGINQDKFYKFELEKIKKSSIIVTVQNRDNKEDKAGGQKEKSARRNAYGYGDQQIVRN